jgi:hypothetical protein
MTAGAVGSLVIYGSLLGEKILPASRRSFGAWSG